MSAERNVTLDCDVLFGTWPPRAQIPMDLPAVQAKLAKAAIGGAIATSARGAWFDDIEGNTETIELVRPHASWVPAATINLRNALRTEAELDRVVAAGVRAVRLFPVVQSIGVGFPGLRHVVDQALQRDLTLLVEGDVRAYWSAFAGRNARVIFLDVHSYHLADFILLAREEPGFVASTRLLNAPDSIEQVTADVGAGHLAFGSRTPLHSISPALIRLQKARISEQEFAAVAGGTAKALLAGDRADG
ncbi:MAG TPA: hypothetical protein VHC49_27305 [Mycobacteriales bacterium]|nr:hypothetical protein [Mycobacteriales bacterium]